jgi:hypothetical protein
MRLVLALVTSAMLASTASAQSIAPELQSKSGGAAYAPVVAIAPAIAAPTPIASASVDRAELGAEPIAPQPVPAQGIAAGPSLGTHGEAVSVVAGDDKLQPARKARAAIARVEPRKPAARTDVQPAHRYRPVASGTREFGRFWPPVF